MKRQIFIYWVGKEYKLITILRKLIYGHSKTGKGYEVIFLNHDNIKDYIKKIPDRFYSLVPAHQADFVRVNVIYEYGGIWLDSDAIVIDNLDLYFDYIEKYEGFIMISNNTRICNGFFGSKKKTGLLLLWKQSIDIFLKNNDIIKWNSLGSDILTNIYNEYNYLYDNFYIINGHESIFPVNWNKCLTEYIFKPYDNYKKIIRFVQPLIILINDIYKSLEIYSTTEILNGNMPINYFINKSLDNLNNNNNNFMEDKIYILNNNIMTYNKIY